MLDPVRARVPCTSIALDSMAGVAFSSGINESGGVVSSASQSSPDLAEYPTSSTVTTAIRTSPRSIRSIHASAFAAAPSRT